MPLKIMPVMTIGTFLAPRAMAVPINEMTVPTKKNGFRPKMSDSPPERGSAMDTEIVYELRIQL